MLFAECLERNSNLRQKYWPAQTTSVYLRDHNVSLVEKVTSYPKPKCCRMEIRPRAL